MPGKLGEGVTPPVSISSTGGIENMVPPPIMSLIDQGKLPGAVKLPLLGAGVGTGGPLAVLTWGLAAPFDAGPDRLKGAPQRQPTNGLISWWLFRSASLVRRVPVPTKLG